MDKISFIFSPLQIRRAHVVCIVYAVDDEDTLDSVTDHWLPFVRRTLGSENHTTPVILVGNKVRSEIGDICLTLSDSRKRVHF